MKIRVSGDPEECALLWQKIWPSSCIFDLWQVRACFAEAYGRTPFFVVAGEESEGTGFLPLSWIEEEGYFGNFPGETWQGRTWLEQNLFLAGSAEIREAMLECVPGPVRLRYMRDESCSAFGQEMSSDETGYLFYPGAYDYSFDEYMREFSGKSRKALARELGALENHGVAYRYNSRDDLDEMFTMNLAIFGQWSYFSDPRFLNAFERLADLLSERGLLRVTTLLLGGEIAAIDMGVVWNNSYTVLAGGANPEFPGVAKMINFHHLKRACEQKISSVDFLCGDFGWKRRFHLSARQLHKISFNETGTHALAAGPMAG